MILFADSSTQPTRIQSMNPRTSRFALLPLLFLYLANPLALRAEAPANVVIFFVDDLGYADIGCYGSSFYDTPNVDRLAAEGARFTDGYAESPVCSPTRASFMTGKYSPRTGVTNFIGAPQPDRWQRNTPMLPTAYTTRLALEERTLAEALKEGGYHTFFAGKWHLGPEGYWPEDQGFDHNFGGHDRGGPYGGDKYFSPYGNPRLEDGPDGEHLPDRLARETADFIERHRDEPFFAILSFYSVHTPLISRADLQAKYEERARELGEVPEGELWGRDRLRKVRQVQNHAIYAGMVEAMDAAVGTVLDRLKALGLDERTLVIFTSDNGGLSTSEGHPTSNLPLRAGKGWLYEGGIRVPLIARWSGTIKAGRVVETPATTIDLYPTILNAAGLEPAQGQLLDGVDLLPLFRGEGGPGERDLFWHFPHYGNQGGFPGSAIRRGGHKLIEFFEDGSLELYDLAADLGEERDLAAAKPELIAELHEALKQWRADVGAKLPIANPKYDPTQSPDYAAQFPHDTP